MDSDQEFKVVKTSRGLKHVPVGTSEASPNNVRKTETKRLFNTKVSATFNLGSNAKFDIARVTKFFEAIKRTDKNAVIVPVNKPQRRIYFAEDVPREGSVFQDILEPETVNRGKQVQVVFYLESNIKVAEIKKSPTVNTFLNQEPKTFFREHEWTSTKVVSVGMFTNKLFNATFRQDYQKKIQDVIEKAITEDITDTEKDDNVSETTEPTNKKSPEPKNPDIPRIEISPIQRSYWKQDDKGKRIGNPTHSMVLNVRCESHHAELIAEILYENSKNMNKFEYGLFMSYDHARKNNDLFGKMLKDNNEFHNATTVIPIYGLHEEVLHGKEAYDTSRKVFYNGYDFLSNFSVCHAYEDKEIWNRCIFSIERTNQSAELGKWFFIVSKEYFTEAEDMIIIVSQDWEVTKTYVQHLDDNESFQKGLRSENTPSTHFENPGLYYSHEKLLEENVSYIGNESIESNSTSNTKSNKRKKLNTITFEYSAHEFPQFIQSPAPAQPPKNAWKDPIPDVNTNASNSTNSSNSTLETNQSLLEFQTKFDGQIAEMQNFMSEKSKETKQNQESIQQRMLIQNEQIGELRKLLVEQEERHHKDMNELLNKMDNMTDQFTALLMQLNKQNTMAETNMDITPNKGKKKGQSIISTIYSLTGATRPDDTEEEDFEEELHLDSGQEKSKQAGETKKFDLPPLR